MKNVEIEIFVMAKASSNQDEITTAIGENILNGGNVYLMTSLLMSKCSLTFSIM